VQTSVPLNAAIDPALSVKLLENGMQHPGSLTHMAHASSANELFVFGGTRQ
jgi:hypothetical protein